MSDTPRETPEEVLDRVMSQGLAPEGEGPEPEAPAPEMPAPETPPTEEPAAPPEAEAKPPAPSKPAKRSSVYLYLLVLFGAAFMMLLLAYFVQQRSSETAMSDLRDSMNLSRAQLIEEIDGLKEEKEALETELQSMEDDQKKAQEWRDFLEEQNRMLDDQYTEASFHLARACALSFLERFCAEEDWLMAACVVEYCDHLFNVHNRSYGPAAPLAAALAERYLQLREEVFQEAGSLVAERTDIDPEDEEHYFESVFIVPEASRYGEEAVETARQLWSILYQYAQGGLENAATLLRAFCNTDQQYQERLESAALQPATVALSQQVKDDLIHFRLLVEDEDGNITLWDEGNQT